MRFRYDEVMLIYFYLLIYFMTGRFSIIIGTKNETGIWYLRDQNPSGTNGPDLTEVWF